MGLTQSQTTMSDEAFIKAEKDYSQTLDKELPEIASLSLKDSQDAVEKLLALEKKVRQASDLASSKRVLSEIVKVLRNAGDWKQMNETVQLLSKKHGQLKTAVASLIQEVIAGLDDAPSLATKIETIDNVRTICEGKIYLEMEHARVTRMLAQIKEDEGDISAAADLLGELQVETFGSMDMREKTEFILKQMELYIKKGDFTFAAIVSRKILPRYFDKEEVHDQKLRYYELSVEIALHDNKYLETCQDYRHIYDTPVIQADEKRKQTVLTNMVLFAILAPHDNLRNDLLHKLALESDLPQLPVYEQLVRMFTTLELIRWPKVEEVYGDKLKTFWVFDVTDAESGAASTQRWQDLRQRVIEHNILVIAKFYTRITIAGLAELLDLTPSEAEKILAKLVTSGMVYARINRPQRIVSFAKTKDTNDVLNEWSYNTGKLLEHVETIGHLIAKEEMMLGIRTKLG